VVEGGAEHAPALDPGAVVVGNTEIGVDQPLGGDTAQADQYLGLQKGDLVFQVADAGILLLGLRIPVSGRAAFDNIGNIAVVPVQIDDGEHIVQELTRRTHKGDALQVLLFSGSLANEEQLALPVAHTKDHIMPRPAQLAAVAVQAAFFQRFPILHY